MSRSAAGSGPTRARLVVGATAAALLAAVFAAAGIGVRATDGGQAAVDEPQYLLSALSLAEDGDLDIADELADTRALPFHQAPLPVQTQVRLDGSQVSPHDPLLPLLVAPAVGAGGWVAAKTLLAGLAGVLAALTVWVGVRRLGAPLGLTAAVVATGFTSAPLAVYGQQVYPELPAALAVLAAVAALTGRMRGAGVAVLVLAVTALPWLSVKYAPVAAVLAVTGLVLLCRGGRRLVAGVVAGTLALAGLGYLAAHRMIYGGWTAYASADHFQSSGEVGVLGFAPDFAGRSTRLVALLVDRDFGLVAWQPAFLLVVPAVGALPWLLPRRWPVLVGPLLAGWLVASFVALTMHGFWWPGRQLVVVLPLGLLAVAVLLGGLFGRLHGTPRRMALTAAAVLAGSGTLVYGWVLVAGWSGRLTWVGAADEPVPALLDAARTVLPDYRDPSTATWALHACWAVLLAALLVLGALAARRQHPPSRPVRPAAVTGQCRRATAGAATAVALLAATGCTQTGDDQVVRVYSARHYDLEQAFGAFSDETGVSVEFLYGDDAALRERIQAEGEDTLADLYMTVDAGNLALAADEGVFAPVQSGTLNEAVPANLRDSEGRWYGLAARARTIVYDPSAVDPSELSTYEALADPQWDGRLCLRGATETYTQSLVASMIARLGYDEAKRVVAGWVNGAEIFSNDVELLENIASGDCEVGIANHYYLAQLVEEDPDFPVEIFWANQQTSGTHVNVSGAGVTAEADDPELAKQLLEWLATDGQDELTAGNFEYPVNTDVEPVPIVAGFGGFDADRLEAAALGRYNADAIRLMAETGYE